MPVPIFDGLWPINLKLLSQKGEWCAQHMRWQLMLFADEQTKVVTR